MVMLPSDPSDDIVAKVIHSKLNALGGKYLEFGIIELTSDDKSGLSYLFTGNGEHAFPDMDHWVGTHAYYDKPWWARDDSSTIDLIPAEDEDTSNRQYEPSDLEFIRESIMRQYGNPATVVRPNFKPVVIDGQSET
jgi:hypothetical protein